MFEGSYSKWQSPLVIAFTIRFFKRVEKQSEAQMEKTLLC